METIFDHNVTEKEMELLLGFVWTKEEYVNRSHATQRGNHVAIYNLYGLRGDMETVQKYADKIPNDSTKIFDTCYRDYIRD
jgi:hypothetical protein